MSQDGDTAGSVNKVDTLFNTAPFIGDIRRAAAIKERIEYGLHIGEIAAADKHARNMRTSYGAALVQDTFDFPPLQGIAESRTTGDHFPGPVQAPPFKIAAVAVHVRICGVNIITEDMDITAVVFAAHLNSRNNAQPVGKTAGSVISGKSIMIGYGNRIQARRKRFFSQVLRCQDTVGTVRVHV